MKFILFVLAAFLALALATPAPEAEPEALADPEAAPEALADPEADPTFLYKKLLKKGLYFPRYTYPVYTTYHTPSFYRPTTTYYRPTYTHYIGK